MARRAFIGAYAYNWVPAMLPWWFKAAMAALQVLQSLAVLALVLCE
jgi:hypothetical protein